MYTSNPFFIFFESVTISGVHFYVSILSINEERICENLATAYNFWKQENIWYSQWNNGNIRSRHIKKKMPVVFSVSRSIAFILSWGMSHNSFKEHPQWVMTGLGENVIMFISISQKAEDFRSHIWMNFSWFIETLIMSDIPWTLSCLSKNSLMLCLVST